MQSDKVTDQRLTDLEEKQDKVAMKIQSLQQSLNEIRDSAIRGKIASEQKTKDVANKFNLTLAQVSQIALQRLYNND